MKKQCRKLITKRRKIFNMQSTKSTKSKEIKKFE